MKKQLLSICFALFAAGVFAQGTWVSQATNFAPVSSGVRYISPVDTNVLWICAYDGSGGGADRRDYSRTLDGGQQWTAATVPVSNTYDWSMIHGVSADTAFAVFYDPTAATGGGIWRTTDAGATWTQCGAGQMYATGASFPNVVHFWNSQEGWAMGDPLGGYFELYKTLDGGNTWTRTPQANIPAPQAGEYGIVGHYCVIGDNVWFDTQKGRVYRSTDRGNTWQVATTSILVPSTGVIDIAFTSVTDGIARLYNATTGVNTVKRTTDGGATWSTLAITGNFWGNDVKWVPGTASMLVSTGAATGLSGSSYSLDGGANWTTIETAAQRTALGVVDSTHWWTGGFTMSPSSGGIFRYQSIPVITCNDANINPGTAVGNVPFICPGDTVLVTTTGVVAPTVGDYAGLGWILSFTDVSGNPDPQNDPGYVGGSGIQFPAPATGAIQLINDGSLIDGVNLPYGTYYFTPVVLGNAIGTSASIINVTLDPACTYAGNSVAVYVADPNDTLCTTTGIAQVDASTLSVRAYQSDAMGISLRISSKSSGTANIEVLDIMGRSVYSDNKQVQNGINAVRIDSTLPSGTYITKVTVNGNTAVTKFVKQ
ncbi:MAG: T9SS type A sorting domain-containing protein [Bacteroidota bacterium]